MLCRESGDRIQASSRPLHTPLVFGVSCLHSSPGMALCFSLQTALWSVLSFHQGERQWWALFKTAIFLIRFSTIFYSSFMILLKASSHETCLFSVIMEILRALQTPICTRAVLCLRLGFGLLQMLHGGCRVDSEGRRSPHPHPHPQVVPSGGMYPLH